MLSVYEASVRAVHAAPDYTSEHEESGITLRRRGKVTSFPELRGEAA